MSASNPSSSGATLTLKNFYSFNGQTGGLGNYNTEEDTLEEVAMPLRMLLLDTDAFYAKRSSQNGTRRKVVSTMGHPRYNKTIQIRYDDQLPGEATNVIYTGPWSKATKKQLEAAGVPSVAYHKTFFFAEALADKTVVRSRLQLHGKAMMAYIDQSNAAIKLETANGNKPKDRNLNDTDFVVTIVGTEITPSTIGAPSHIPIFKFELASDKAKALQIEQDYALQAELAEYFDNGFAQEDPADVSSAAAAPQATPQATPQSAPPATNPTASAPTNPVANPPAAPVVPPPPPAAPPAPTDDDLPF